MIASLRSLVVNAWACPLPDRARDLVREGDGVRRELLFARQRPEEQGADDHEDEVEGE